MGDGPPGMGGGPPGMGSGQFSSGNGVRKVAGKKEEKDKNTIQIPITRCTVQFVWKPVPLDQRSVFKLLYEFFRQNPKQNPTEAFQKAREFVDDQRKYVEEMNRNVSTPSERTAPPPQLTQELFNEYVKKNHTKTLPKKTAAGE